MDKEARCTARTPSFVCEGNGKNSEHRMGGPTCNEARIKGWRPPMKGRRNGEKEKRREEMETNNRKEFMEGVEEEEEIEPKRIRLRRRRNIIEDMEEEEEKAAEDKGKIEDNGKEKYKFEFIAVDGAEDPLEIEGKE